MLFLAVGAAGMIGALLRYYFGVFFHGWWQYSFPLGTLLTNYIGCFVLAWFTAWVGQARQVPHWFRVGFGTGLIGSFTTFSTFSVESITLLREQLWGVALLYIALSLIGGLLLAWGGLQFARFQLAKRRVSM